MSQKNKIYLDSNAGAPLLPLVREKLKALLDHPSLANPSSIHSDGRVAKKLLLDARESIAQSIFKNQNSSDQIVLTSSGTEANQTVIQSVLTEAFVTKKRPHWITSAVEHDSVMQMREWFEAQGGIVTLVGVDLKGSVNLKSLENEIIPESTALVSLVWVNNETGVVSPVEEVSKITKQNKIPLHLDGAQAWGKIELNYNELSPDYLTFSSHKIGAPAGVGIIALGKNVKFAPLIFGKQEKGRRGGTENLFGIVGAGVAASTLNPKLYEESISPKREYLEQLLARLIEGVKINGMGSQRVCNTLNLSFEGVHGDGLVMALDLAGYCVSSGSACSSGALEPSHVLMAMGLSKKEAMAAVRVSLNYDISLQDIDHFVENLATIVNRIRNAASKRPVSQTEQNVF